MAVEAYFHPSYNSGSVGVITCDADNVRGEGGPYDARLVLPLKITLDPQVEQAALVLTRLSCTLHLGEPAAPFNQVGPSVAVVLPANRPVMSATQRPSSSDVEARLFLSQSLLAQLEAHRHTDPDNTFVGALAFDGTLAWAYKTSPYYTDATPGPHRFAQDEWPFDFNAGASLFAPIWTARIEPLRLRIPAAIWVANVLPGLGLDRLRLVELTLPTVGEPLPDTIVPLFDAARRDYDAGRYLECIQKCRDIRHAVERHLGATATQRVADVVATRLRLAPDAPQRAFLDGAWRALTDFTNSTHHVGQTGIPICSAADARTCLFLTITLLDYLRYLHTPPPIGFQG